MKNYFYIPLVLIALLFASCSQIDDPDAPATKDSEKIILSFRIDTDAISSRTDDQDHEEVMSEYREFEDGIDFHDVGLFIFAKMENAPDDAERLVAKMVNLANVTSGSMEILSSSDDMGLTGGPGSYIVNVMMTTGQLSAVLGQDIEPNDSEKVQFRVMLLVNSTTFGTSGKLEMRRWNNVTGQTYSEVLTQISRWPVYPSSYICNFNNQYDALDVVPSGSMVYDLYPNKTNGRSNMPMFGTEVFLASQRALFESGSDRPVWLGTMYMLRSLAKVRLLDKIDNRDAQGYPRIKEAIFIGVQHNLRPLPYNALTYVNGTQVHEPNKADLNYEQNNPQKFIYRLGILPSSWSNMPDMPEGTIRVGYVPEMGFLTLDDDENGNPQGLPAFRITVAMSVDAEGNEVLRSFEVPLTGYKGQTFDFGENILRNHIYTLSVTHVTPVLEVED